jgi:hypothetical protein
MEFTPAPEIEQSRSDLGTWQSPDKSGGLNGSTHHLLEADAQGFLQLSVVATADSSGTPSWPTAGHFGSSVLYLAQPPNYDGLFACLRRFNFQFR